MPWKPKQNGILKLLHSTRYKLRVEKKCLFDNIFSWVTFNQHFIAIIIIIKTLLLIYKCVAKVLSMEELNLKMCSTEHSPLMPYLEKEPQSNFHF